MGVAEATVVELERTPRKCDLLHGLAKIHASFDDPHLVSRAGLVPVMALAQRAALSDLVAEHVRISRRCGVNAHLKGPCLGAGMVAGADSIDDMDLLRHGAMPALFGGGRGAGCCWRTWRDVRRGCPAGRPWRSWTSTPCRNVSTGITRTARRSVIRRSRGRACSAEGPSQLGRAQIA